MNARGSKCAWVREILQSGSEDSFGIRQQLYFQSFTSRTYSYSYNTSENTKRDFVNTLE